MIITNHGIVGAVRTTNGDEKAEWAADLAVIARWLTALCAEEIGQSLAKLYVRDTVENVLKETYSS